MKISTGLFIALMTGVLTAQAPVTPTAVLAAQNSQINTLESCLVMSAQVQAPGAGQTQLSFIMGFNSLSSTYAYECAGSPTTTGPGFLTLSGVVEGAPNLPFVLAASVIPAGLPCGGPTSIPCLTGPYLFSSFPTTWGTYHLDLQPIILLDGFGVSQAPAGTLTPFGNFPVVATIPVDTVANGGVETRFALQALVSDPTAAAGFTLSACLNVDQWVDQP